MGLFGKVKGKISFSDKADKGKGNNKKEVKKSYSHDSFHSSHDSFQDSEAWNDEDVNKTKSINNYTSDGSQWQESSKMNNYTNGTYDNYGHTNYPESAYTYDDNGEAFLRTNYDGQGTYYPENYSRTYEDNGMSYGDTEYLSTGKGKYNDNTYGATEYSSSSKGRYNDRTNGKTSKSKLNDGTYGNQLDKSRFYNESSMLSERSKKDTSYSRTSKDKTYERTVNSQEQAVFKTADDLGVVKALPLTQESLGELAESSKMKGSQHSQSPRYSRDGSQKAGSSKGVTPIIHNQYEHSIEQQVNMLFPDDATQITDFTSVSRRAPVEPQIPVAYQSYYHQSSNQQSNYQSQQAKTFLNSNQLKSPGATQGEKTQTNKFSTPQVANPQIIDDNASYIYAPTVLFTEGRDHANFIGEDGNPLPPKEPSYSASVVGIPTPSAKEKSQVWNESNLAGTSVLERFGNATNSKFKKGDGSELPVWVSGSIVDISKQDQQAQKEKFLNPTISSYSLAGTIFQISNLFGGDSSTRPMDFGLNQAAIKYPNAYQSLEIRVVSISFRSWDSSALKIWLDLFSLVTSDDQKEIEKTMKKLQEEGPGLTVGILDPFDRLISTWYSLHEAAQSPSQNKMKSLFGGSKYRVQLPVDRSIFIPLEQPLPHSPEMTVPVDLDLLLQTNNNEALAAARFQVPITLKDDSWHIASSELIKSVSSNLSGVYSAKANIHTISLYRADQILPIQAETEEKSRFLEDLCIVGKVELRFMQITPPNDAMLAKQKDPRVQKFLSATKLSSTAGSPELNKSLYTPYKEEQGNVYSASAYLQSNVDSKALDDLIKSTPMESLGRPDKNNTFNKQKQKTNSETESKGSSINSEHEPYKTQNELEAKAISDFDISSRLKSTTKSTRSQNQTSNSKFEISSKLEKTNSSSRIGVEDVPGMKSVGIQKPSMLMSVGLDETNSALVKSSDKPTLMNSLFRKGSKEKSVRRPFNSSQSPESGTMDYKSSLNREPYGLTVPSLDQYIKTTSSTSSSIESYNNNTREQNIDYKTRTMGSNLSASPLDETKFGGLKKND